ncbi:hypothetical protein C440_13439 [Haloferax mucosum ATCC BAA-1512]|uniref:Uncharacterized protein n=1 Tax=Haloferax mucosum ATCC BAA-1512 TaxID=662479 RepID=M0I3E5_9EURY|nr:hypothetical protein [Haloferax mucosum]ELZ91320.1 hypothetical protein C440_13439 [Haloferax mucosum ATCC BAA-1512]
MDGTVSPIAVFAPAAVFGGFGFICFTMVGAGTGLVAVSTGLGVVFGIAIGVLVSRGESL